MIQGVHKKERKTGEEKQEKKEKRKKENMKRKERRKEDRLTEKGDRSLIDVTRGVCTPRRSRGELSPSQEEEEDWQWRELHPSESLALSGEIPKKKGRFERREHFEEEEEERDGTDNKREIERDERE